MACGFGVYYSLAALYPALLKSELGAADRVASLTALFNVGMLIGAVVTGWLAAVAARSWRCGPGAADHPAPAALRRRGAGGAGARRLRRRRDRRRLLRHDSVLLTGLFAPEVRARSVGIVYHLGAIPAAFAAMAIAALSESTGLTLGASIAVTAGGLELLLATALIVARFKLNAPAPAMSAAAPADMALDAK